jgi:hypothetical protein
MSTRLPIFALSILGGCALAGDPYDDAEGAATSGELRFRAGELTLWVDRAIELGYAGDDRELTATIHCRTSRNLTGASSWVPDDAFGEATIVGPRSFDITLYGPHEINTVLSGLPVFVSLDVATGTPTHYEAMIDLEVGLAVFRGTGDAWIDSLLRAVLAGPPDEPLRYRAGVATDSPTLSIENAGAPGVTAKDGGFVVDWNYPDIEATITDGYRAGFRLADGTRKTARFEFRTARIGLTTADPRDVWPSTCEPAVRACLDDGGEPAECGSYRQVTRCQIDE